jgi:hypothetical protein
VKEPEWLAAPARGVGAIGRGQRLLGEHDGDGIEVGVHGLQSREDGLRRLATSDLARADGGGQRDRVPAPELRVHAVLSCVRSRRAISSAIDARRRGRCYHRHDATH